MVVEMMNSGIPDTVSSSKNETDMEAAIQKPTMLFRIFGDISTVIQVLLLVGVYESQNIAFRFQAIFGVPYIEYSILIFCVSSTIFNYLTKHKIYNSNTPVKFYISTQFVFLLIFLVFAPFLLLNLLPKYNFDDRFLESMKNAEKYGKIHQFQQEFQCCGVELPNTTNWNDSTLPFSNPWSSWYYHLILDEKYILEARRIYTLPWSCCQQMHQCEHLAFERVSSKIVENLSNDDRKVDDEIELVDSLLGIRPTDRAISTIFQQSCSLKNEQNVEMMRRNTGYLMVAFVIFGAISTVAHLVLNSRLE